MTEVKEIESNIDHSCSPFSSLYCNLKIRLVNDLNQKDLNHLYNCSLCNNCHLANFNKTARKKAVDRSLILKHVNEIKENIRQYGNSYGIRTPEPRDENSKMDTVLFRGCTPTHKTPEILEAVETLLSQEKIKYNMMDNETCCGNILFNLGDSDSGYQAVQENIKKFKAAGVKKIITLCPGCYHAFWKYYKGQDGFNPEIILVLDLLEKSILAGDGFIIQDPCHAKEKSKAVRKMLNGSINKNASPCCGAGAGVMAHDKNLAHNKAKKALKRNKTIVTYCPFCYLNLSSVNPEKIRDIHAVEPNMIQKRVNDV